MRRLLLLRHAKSSWDQRDQEDVQRPLAPRGRQAAPLIGRHLSGQGLVPDLVLCSTAERARQTLALVRAEWDRADGEGAAVEMRASLYLAPPGEMLAALRRLDDATESVMIIGHN
ncbi:MAG: SixA phosphatase family protein, partial [Geminicoccaceae bacterium]